MAQVSRTDVLQLRAENDVVAVRQAVRTWAIQQGFSLVDQTKMVTAASEIARNTVIYGGGGTLRIEAGLGGTRRGFRLIFEGQGAGVEGVGLGPRGGYTTRTRPGLGGGGARG